MTTQLALYNLALTHLGERKLASLSENREPRRVLDVFWDGAVHGCLEQGLWRFARRTAKIVYSPSIEPDFGYHRVFAHPDDFVRVAMLCEDEYFRTPLREYSTEGGFWFADLDQIYVSYISDDLQYGGDLSLWPQSFVDWVSTWLASKAALRITNDEEKVKDLFAMQNRLLVVARSRDAMGEPSKTAPHGTWANSRSNKSSRWDRGNRNSLLG